MAQANNPDLCRWHQMGTGWPTCRVGCRRCKTDVRDAKNIVACMRSANMPKGRPTCRGGSPRCKKVTMYYHVLLRTTPYYHILLRTTTYYHVQPRTTTYTITYYYNDSFCISGSHRCMSYYILLFTISLHIVLPWPMFGVGSPRCKKIPCTTTYYHVLLRTTTYYHVLPRTTTYYQVLPRTTMNYYNQSLCISGSHPCMSALSFQYFPKQELLGSSPQKKKERVRIQHRARPSAGRLNRLETLRR